MNIFVKIKAKKELKKQQKEKTIKELQYELSVKDAKIKNLENNIKQYQKVKEIINQIKRDDIK